jgi:hypothetical protein
MPASSQDLLNTCELHAVEEIRTLLDTGLDP